MDDDNMKPIIDELRAAGIARLEWSTYWYDDEGQMGAWEAWRTDGSSTTRWDAVPSDVVQELEYLSWREFHNYGVFRIDVEAGTIARIGDAWMPDPEIATTLFDEAQVETKLLAQEV